MLVFILFQALTLALCAAGQESNSTTSTTSSSPGKYPLTTDAHCGTGNGRMCLINGTSPCCSSSGYCGNGDEFCKPSDCQEDYGKCQSNKFPLDNYPECSWSPVGTSPRCDGRCGASYHNAICSSTASADAFEMYGVYDYGPCCSSTGFCGSTSDHCDEGCQSGCGNNSTQSSTTGSPPASTASASAAEHNDLPPWSMAFAFFPVLGLMLGL